MFTKVNIVHRGEPLRPIARGAAKRARAGARRTGFSRPRPGFSGHAQAAKSPEMPGEARECRCVFASGLFRHSGGRRRPRVARAAPCAGGGDASLLPADARGMHAKAYGSLQKPTLPTPPPFGSTRARDGRRAGGRSAARLFSAANRLSSAFARAESREKPMDDDESRSCSQTRPLSAFGSAGGAVCVSRRAPTPAPFPSARRSPRAP
jgi:hypothetical protein